MFKRKQGTLQMARPRSQTMYGIELKKQPVGRYFEVLDQTGNIVSELLDAAFPGQTPSQILDLLSRVTSEELKALFVRLMGALPRKLVAILRSIVGAEENPAWEELTPAEMAKVCKAFWELNDLNDFFVNARSAVQQLVRQQKAKTASTGSSD